MINQKISSAKTFYLKCKRVWSSLRKPTKKEFSTVAKVSAVGILILGAFGFAIAEVMRLFF